MNAENEHGYLALKRFTSDARALTAVPGVVVKRIAKLNVARTRCGNGTLSDHSEYRTYVHLCASITTGRFCASSWKVRIAL